jgi:hypothetical protein
VTGVKRAHRRNEAHTLTANPRGIARGAHLGGTGDDARGHSIAKTYRGSMRELVSFGRAQACEQRPMSRLHRSPLALVVLVGVLAEATSRAGTPDALQRARELFLQAEADEDANRWPEALEKLRAVSQVKLTAGVRYHLALCEEHLGQLARALGDFKAAEEQARVDGAKDVLRTVGKELIGLDLRVPRLTIQVTPAVPDTSVRLDGEPIAEALAGVAIPVDPGVHYIEVRAPDRAVSAQTVALRERESKSLEFTLTPPVPSSTSTGTPTPTTHATEPTPALSAALPPAHQPHPNQAPAIVATAISVALAGGGVAAFLVAGAAHNRAVRECNSLPTSASNACDYLKSPVRAWDFAAAGAWLGALAAGAVAVVLWTKHHENGDLTGAPDSRSPARTSVLFGPAPFGVGGQF